jgi:hypothetical protein
MIPEPIIEKIDAIKNSEESSRTEIINAILEEALIRKPEAFYELLQQSGGTGLVLKSFKGATINEGS